jgi:hypothetical protein
LVEKVTTFETASVERFKVASAALSSDKVVSGTGSSQAKSIAATVKSARNFFIVIDVFS